GPARRALRPRRVAPPGAADREHLPDPGAPGARRLGEQRLGGGRPGRHRPAAAPLLPPHRRRRRAGAEGAAAGRAPDHAPVGRRRPRGGVGVRWQPAVALAGALLFALLQQDLFEWCRWLAERLVRSAARRLPPAYRRRYQEEWLAELGELRGRNVSALLWALWVFACTRPRSAAACGRRQPTAG